MSKNINDNKLLAELVAELMKSRPQQKKVREMMITLKIPYSVDSIEQLQQVLCHIEGDKEPSKGIDL